MPAAAAALALLLATAAADCRAQSASALQLPLSGNTQSGASVEQSATPSMSSSVNTINTQLRIQGGYNGSELDAAAPSGVLNSTFPEAIRRALQFNLGKIGADAASQQAQAQRISALSSLLPNVSASLSENAAKADLQAEGFNSSLFGSSLGFTFPNTVGPFHYYDLRGSVQQSILDLTAVHNYRSSRESANASILDARQAREEVVLAVTGAYLQLMATSALIDAQRTEVQYAEASFKQARAQADAGNKAPIDANRGLVELQTEQQRLRSQLGDFENKRMLLRGSLDYRSVSTFPSLKNWKHCPATPRHSQT